MESAREGARTIVVGVDGSPSSTTALHWAVEFARMDGSAVEAVTAWDYLPWSGWGLPIPGSEVEEAARIALSNTVEREEDSTESPVPIRQRVEYGHPAEVPMQAARGARLLVVGSRGLGSFKGTMPGSVSRHCVEHSPCPVVVVRGAA
ncbi:universal stress protein [Kitasatospora sp. NPDC054795]